MLVAGAKDIENRAWSTDYRGPIVIAASASKTQVNQIARFKNLKDPSIDFLYGALIGVVDVLDVTPLSDALEENPWASGPYCWRIGNARRFAKPIPAKGKLKLFQLDADLAEQARIAIQTSTEGRPNLAEVAWIDALTHLDDERARYVYLYESYIELDDGANALRLAEKALCQWADADGFTDRAFAKFHLTDLEGALNDANHAIQLDPSLARAYLIRSYIFDAFAERDEAKANELNPTLLQKGGTADDGSVEGE
jgi:hypothetical protein